MPVRVFGMMTVRDEEDIIEESLSHAAAMFDTVLVVDCGSSDGTPIIAKRIATQNENVKFVASIEPATSMQVKRHIWAHFKNTLSWSDWWCFADADEFIDAKYREILYSPNMKLCDHIIGEHVNFYYKKKEYIEDLSEDIEELRRISVRERRKFYRYHTKQVRFFRNLPWLKWNGDAPLPDFLSCPAPKRIRFYHYQYRDPKQIASRVEIRKKEYYRSDPSNLHWLKKDARDALSEDDDKTLNLLGTMQEPVKDLSLVDEKRQKYLKTIAKYAKNILTGISTKGFHSTRFEK